MSIPPLVCSTPPPPEQCEDDKDQEDFDLNYHLSQEEDENNDYDYDNFSNFNNFKSTSSKPCQEFVISQDEHVKCDKNTLQEEALTNNTKPDEEVSRVPLDDDILEDLNLEIDQESAVSTQKNVDVVLDTNLSEKVAKPVENFDIPVDSTISELEFKLRNEVKEVADGENVENSMTLDLTEKPQSVPDEVLRQKTNDCGDSETDDRNPVDDIAYSNTDNDISETVDNKQESQLEKNLPVDDKENIVLDEFEDFDDFKFVSSDSKPSQSVVDAASENPWQDDVSKNDEFGDFTANFEETDNFSVKQAFDEALQNQHDSEDDFGDFDEFKSVNDLDSNNATSDPYEEVSVLNFHSSDSEHQIIERINKVIHTIFENEITECDHAFESRLEGSLGETWNYLRETDVRQPYIVNWNNSLAQKTLLKALCIDSRNILFGPKWGSSMPKYAAALSTAPLQPQKQAGQSNVPPSEVNSSETSANKTWSDPFTADGQEFTYAEALLLDLEHLMATLDQMAHNHSTLKISELLSHACHTDRDNTVIETGPTDLDVFEAAISTKPDKIYSNTISIQPIRQINLPDTHIFTPTNSEIPRSKTIHYDNTPATVIMPQGGPDNSSSQTNHSENDSDYWEFQDFRGTPSKALEPAVNQESKDHKDVAHKANNINIATQVLQPIKLEPIMPTLNWPDPGEVKETFDDFSDFISNLPSTNENKETISPSLCANAPYNSKNEDKCREPDEVEINQLKTMSDDKIDDEFEMFQSAMPSSKNTTGFDYNKTGYEFRDQPSSSQITSAKMTDFDLVFSNVDKEKSENISVDPKPIENVLKNIDNTQSMFKSQPVPSTALQTSNTNVLQPSLASLATPSSTKQSQQKVSQILQPLSLESYSQINWPNPGIDLQDLSRFNPVESLHSLKNESNSQSKTASPVHSQKGLTNNNQTSDDDIWGEFVSSKPKQQPIIPKKQATFADDEEWTDFVSSPSANPPNGLNTISLNVHTNSSMQKSSNSTKYPLKTNEISLDIPALNYITPKNNKSYNERHFQNL